MLKLAEQILQSKTTNFDPSQFVDHYEGAVVEMLKTKQAGMPVSRELAAPPPKNVVNLMDALRRSIAQEDLLSQFEHIGLEFMFGMSSKYSFASLIS